MQQMYNCPRCGQPVAQGTLYCGTCGTQLTWPSQSQQQQQQYQQQPPPQQQYQQQPQQPYQQQYQQPQQQQYGQPYQQQYSQYGVQKSKKRGMSGWLIGLCVVIGLIIIGVLIGALSGGSSDTATTPESTPASSSPKTSAPSAIAISAEKLIEEYEANEIAADAKYEGKLLRITGVVRSIGKDILDEPYVVLTDGDEWALTGVQCYFQTKDEAILGQLSEGQTVTITGKGDGYLMNVMVKDCTLVQ